MSLAPYELHLARRVAKELPFRMLVLVARRDASREWHFDPADGLQLEDLSNGDRDGPMASLPAQLREWRRGGEVIKRLRAADAQAVMIAGYNDVGRLRVASWCRRHGVPVYCRADSNLADEVNKHPLKKALKRRFVSVVRKLFTGVFAVGPQTVAYWKHYGVPAEQIESIPYEPDYELVESITEEEVASVRERFGLDPARRRIVFSGRLTAVKRVDLLIDAFARIADERSDWDLLIVGDGELRAELENRVPEELQARITWAGFLAEQRDVARLYRASDVLVLPSDYEPWALVVNEAAAAGLAIVVSEVVGAGAALVRSGVNGETFPLGDLDTLAEKLLDITDPQAINRYRAASPGVLADWRRDHDPVEGLRSALAKAGVIGS